MPVAVSKITKLFPLFLLMFSLLLFTSCATMTPLTKAAKEGNLQTMQTAIKNGANVNEPSGGKYFASPLHWAARYGYVDAAKLLLDAGADFNGRDYCDQTPLIYAINGNTEGGIEIIKLLIAKGTDTDAIDCFGWKASNHADRSNNNTIIKLIAATRFTSKKTGMDDPDFLPDQSTINFKKAIPKINYKSGNKIAIVVYDKRPYIISGNTKPEYVGYLQNYTRPITKMTTPDKKSLAEVISKCIADGFKANDFDTTQVIFGYQKNDKFKIDDVKQRKPDKIVVITVNEWISDAGYNLGFNYDIDLEIINSQGIVITRAAVKGIDDLKGYEMADLAIKSKILVPEAAQKHLTELLNKPEVAAAPRMAT